MKKTERLKRKLNKEVRKLGVAKQEMGSSDYQDITFI